MFNTAWLVQRNLILTALELGFRDVFELALRLLWLRKRPNCVVYSKRLEEDPLSRA